MTTAPPRQEPTNENDRNGIDYSKPEPHFEAGVASRVIDAAEQDRFWEDNHSAQPYAGGSAYSGYRLAYRAGFEGYAQFHDRCASFEEAEEGIRQNYQAVRPRFTWEEARPAALAAWNRLHDLRAWKS